MNATPAERVLKDYFGFATFRPGQQAIIESILANEDTLAIMPTGGGKSLCFQVPGLVLGNTTIVVSPLISLMKDQVDQLVKKGVSATFLNSSISKDELSDRLENLEKGHYTLVYVAPERLLVRSFLKTCQKITISLVVIDEAHCISQWGHDFRPHYLKISQFIDALSQRPTIAAFTATATTQVQNDIKTSLKLREPKKFLSSFSRKNLSFRAFQAHSLSLQELLLCLLIKKHRDEPGIIYTSTQKQANNLAKLITHFWENKIAVAAYHAGLTNEERSAIQEKFIENKLQLITSTNAFGMGVDKPNVRYVVHYQIPGNLENYYQEAGRAGRDQQPASCYVIYNQADLVIQQGFITQAYPDPQHPRTAVLTRQLKKMVEYATTSQCRQQFINTYFGENAAEVCDSCDNCTHERQLWLPQDLQIIDQVTELVKDISHQYKVGANYILTPLLIAHIAIHQPKTVEDFTKLPGIGLGWIEKWYNIVSKEIRKRAIYGINSTTTRGSVPRSESLYQ